MKEQILEEGRSLPWYKHYQFKLNRFKTKLLIKVGWIKVFNIHVNKDLQSILDVIGQLNPNPWNRFIIHLKSGSMYFEPLSIPDFTFLRCAFKENDDTTLVDEPS